MTTPGYLRPKAWCSKVENIINRILQMDEDAEKRLSDAEKHRKELLALANQERQRIYEQAAQRARAKLELVDLNDKEDAEEEITMIVSRYKDVMSGLKAQYDAGHSGWEDEIFQAVIGLEA